MTSRANSVERAADIIAAGDPATQAEELLRISRRYVIREDRNEPIRTRLAVNPSTPIEVLINLLPEHAESVCRNPIAPLLALEAPERIVTLPVHACWGLLRSEEAPAALVTVLTAYDRNPDLFIAEEARMHVQIAGEMPEGESIRDKIRGFWRLYVGQLSGAKRNDVLLASEMGISPEGFLDDCLGNQPDPMDTLRFQALLERTGPPYRDRMERAADPKTKRQELAQMDSYDHWMQSALATNPNLPRAVRHRLSSNTDYIGVALAANPSTTLDDLKKLIKDSGEAVCRAALRNPALQSPQQRAELISTILHRHLPNDHGNAVTLLRFLSILCVPFIEHSVKPHTLVRSTRWQDRLAIAIAIPAQREEARAALETLSHDGNRLVRAAARARLRGEEVSW